MPALIFPSPVIIDHSFPRSEEELSRTALTLATLAELAKSGQIIFGLTETLIDLVRDFDWTQDAGGLRAEIYRLLSMMCFQPHRGIAVVHFQAALLYEVHPVPTYCDDIGNIEFWADEMGKLVTLHALCLLNGSCAGVACILAFSGEALGTYRPSPNGRFPLVGPSELQSLRDVFEWKVETNAHALGIGYRDVLRNFRAIGGESVERGADHDKIVFRDGRKWPFSKKWGNNIRDGILLELEEYTLLPLAVIKAALKSGREPRRVLRACLANLSLAKS